MTTPPAQAWDPSLGPKLGRGVVSVDSLYSCIVPLFQLMPRSFLTRKSTDLHF